MKKEVFKEWDLNCNWNYPIHSVGVKTLLNLEIKLRTVEIWTPNKFFHRLWIFDQSTSELFYEGFCRKKAIYDLVPDNLPFGNQCETEDLQAPIQIISLMPEIPGKLSHSGWFRSDVEFCLSFQERKLQVIRVNSGMDTHCYFTGGKAFENFDRFFLENLSIRFF